MGIGGGIMSDHPDKLLLEALNRIASTLDQLLEVQRERARVAAESNAAELKLRQDLLKSQQDALVINKVEQRVRRTAQTILVVAGAIALMTLMVSWFMGGRH